ncbi:MAG TPA: YfcE family phosphodiesterase [Rhodothermales bacterium]
MSFETARSLRIGIISDTHGYFHPSIPEAFSDVDCILHAGDLGAVDILDQFEAVAPTMAVFGNIDGAAVRQIVGEHLESTLGGIRVWMTHIGGRPGRWFPGIGEQLRLKRPDLFICGHSHILRIERTDHPVPFLYLNPGAAGRQGMHQEKTCVILNVLDGKPKRADVIHLDAIGRD